MMIVLLAVGVSDRELHAGIHAPESDTIRVHLSISYGDDARVDQRVRSFRNQLESYFRRELRALPDVELVETHDLPDVRVSVLGMPDSYTAPRWYVLTVGAKVRARMQFPEIGQAYEALQASGDSAMAEALLTSAFLLASEALDWGAERHRSVHLWGRDSDILDGVRGIVANIDTEVLEPIRSDR